MPGARRKLVRVDLVRRQERGQLMRYGEEQIAQARLEAALQHATRDPETIHRLALTGNDAVSAGAAAFAERIGRDRAVVKRIVAETGMTIE